MTAEEYQAGIVYFTRLRQLPARLAALVPKVARLSERLPTISAQELAAELDHLTRTLEALRDLRDDVSAPLSGAGTGWRAAA